MVKDPKAEYSVVTYTCGLNENSVLGGRALQCHTFHPAANAFRLCMDRVSVDY
jgi:hypothetical protein